MLTLKLINEETERVIAGLEKKRFKGAREAIEQVLAVDKKRREAQQELDKSLNSQKQLSGQIGKCMKEGKKDEAEQIKQQVSALKETSKQLEEQMAKAQDEMTDMLCQIPNIPYDEVPQGSAAEDNRVVKSNLKECTEQDTVGNWDVNPSLGIANPRLYRQGRAAAACAHQLLPRRGPQERLHGDHAADGGEPGFGLRHGSAARQGGSDVPLRGGRLLPDSDG